MLTSVSSAGVWSNAMATVWRYVGPDESSHSNLFSEGSGKFTGLPSARPRGKASLAN